jgi:hypothetical protein
MTTTEDELELHADQHVDPREALSLYLKAADLLLERTREKQGRTSSVYNALSRVVEKARLIKERINNNGRFILYKEPTSVSDKTLLFRSSKVSNDVYPPIWTSPTASDLENIVIKYGEANDQEPVEILLEDNSAKADISSILCCQNILNDCSVVVSLCIASLYEYMFQGRIVRDCIYKGKDGNYLVVLYINGTFRKVS